jgi:hypothetical protein
MDLILEREFLIHFFTKEKQFRIFFKTIFQSLSYSYYHNYAKNPLTVQYNHVYDHEFQAIHNNTLGVQINQSAHLLLNFPNKQ